MMDKDYARDGLAFCIPSLETPGELADLINLGAPLDVVRSDLGGDGLVASARQAVHSVVITSGPDIADLIRKLPVDDTELVVVVLDRMGSEPKYSGVKMLLSLNLPASRVSSHHGRALSKPHSLRSRASKVETKARCQGRKISLPWTAWVRIWWVLVRSSHRLLEGAKCSPAEGFLVRHEMASTKASRSLAE